MSDQMNRTLLVELGCEELPPLALNRLSTAFFEGVCDGLDQAGIVFDRAASQALHSPRRMSLLLAGVADRQADRVLERKGPSVSAAFDDKGVPTRAATGFAQSVGKTVEELDRLKTDKGEWLHCQIEEPGKPLAALLYPILQAALDALPVPRPMRWSDHEFSFVRPVHWLLVLHGDEVLPGSLYGCDANRLTRGHRIHAPGTHEVARADDYVDLLRQKFVLVDAQERLLEIQESARKVGEAAGGHTRLTNELLGEVNNLVEWPVAVTCSFDETFLDVPAEALIASMEYHQKFFPILSSSDALTREFVVIANIKSTNVEAMRKGYQRVITPRLADARFFWQQDLKQPADHWLGALDRVVFQKNLGTVGDKSRRISALSGQLADIFKADINAAERAGRTCKADLVSQMVGEFPELQGTMGGHYLRHAGEPEAVATAVSEHYHPRFSGDTIPASLTGKIVALADRLDTLVGIFAAGLKPTGNKDPFALRRATLGIIRLLEEGAFEVDLETLLGLARSALAGQIEVTDETIADVLGFVTERLRNHLLESGFSTRQVNAVLAAPLNSLVDLRHRLDAVNAFMQRPEAESLVAANKRIGNILRKNIADVSPTINDNVFDLDEEGNLYRAAMQASSAVTPLYSAGRYQDALEVLAGLRQTVDAYFEAVMVMDERPEIRGNRLAQLAAVKQLFDQVADFSQAD